MACTGADDPDPRSAIDALIESTEPTPIVFDPNDPPQLAGRTVNPATIDAGECFNEYLFRDASDFVQQITTIVGCEGPHDREAYFRAEFPGGETAAYPLENELERWADLTCLDEFESFVGLEYVLSSLEIGTVVPTFDGWTDDGDRAVVCYVFPDGGGRLLASVEDSSI